MRADDAFAHRPVRWPLVSAAVAVVLGVGMLVASAWGFKHARALESSNAAEPAVVATSQATISADSDTAIVAPPYGMHLADVRQLFKLAGEKHLSIASADYQTETNRPADVLIKHVVLHLDDEYPRIKAFLAETLREFPHAQLEEIQIEQPSPPQPPRIVATIKLCFAYRSAGAP